MAVLRRRDRRQDTPEPTADVEEPDVGAAAAAIGTAMAAELGHAVELAEGPEAVLVGLGPQAFRFRLADEGPGSSGALVARIGDADLLAHEAAWIGFGRAAGYPVPELLVVDGEAGVLVFRHPAGVSFAERMLADLSTVADLLGDFARHHVRLHELPTDDAPANRVAPLAELQGRVRGPAVRVLARELAWLEANLPGGDGAEALPAAACHTGYNPAQVFVDGDVATAVPVDWTRARTAEPEYDVAATIVAFWSVTVFLENATYRQMMKMARDGVAWGYLTAYREAATRPVDDGRLKYWQAYHLCWLAADVARHLEGDLFGPWDPAAAVVEPAEVLKEVRKQFWVAVGS